MGTLTQFACTACGKTLKSPKPIPEGTKIKCPKCAQVFVVGSGAAPKRSGGDLSSAPPRRPTRAEKRPRSNPIVKWGTCFFISLIFSVIVWIPIRLGISHAPGIAGEMEKGMKERQQEREKQMKELEKKSPQMPPGLDKPKDKMD